MQEEWKPVIGYEDKYLVSNTGKVFGLKSQQCQKLTTPKYKIKLGNKQNSLYARFWRPGTRRKQDRYTVHSLVMAAFIGPRPQGMEINHIDGNRLNNRLDNLEYVTSSQNSQHAHKILKIKKARGLAVGNAKLSEEDKRTIVCMKTLGFSTKELSKLYDVCISRVDTLYRKAA